MHILVTGGLGFIGKHFVAEALARGHDVTNVDVGSYAADGLAALRFGASPRYHGRAADVAVLGQLHGADVVVHFAAESHVDRSIADAAPFYHSNVLGTGRLVDLVARAEKRPLFVHISTDEVYGPFPDGAADESEPLTPSSPYAASKAASDLIVMAGARTYGFDYNIVRMANNYGPNQYPEKLIPRSLARMRAGLPAELHGDGRAQRTWVHVYDAVAAIFDAIQLGKRNEIYNVGGWCVLTNKEVIETLADAVGFSGTPYVFVPDRKGQDSRYALYDDKLRWHTGWRPRRNFAQEIREIVALPDENLARFGKVAL